MHAVFSDYLAFLDEADRDPQTIANNRQAFERIEAWMRATHRTAATLTRADMKEFVQFLLKRGARNGGPLKASTVERHLIHIRAAYSYAQEMGVVALNPTVGVAKLLPRVPDSAPEILSPGDQRRVLVHFRQIRERLAYYTISLSGLRRHEVLDLRWRPTESQPSYVDFENEQFVVLGKGGKHRLVPMHPILVDLLTRHRLGFEGEHTSHLIQSAWHQRLSERTFSDDFRRLYDRAGLGWVEKPAHILRKTLSTSLTRQGVRPDVIDAIFGWSAQDVRGRYYTGRVTQDMRDAIELAYRDDPVFPEQPQVAVAGEQESHNDEIDLVRLKLQLAQLERENLELALRLHEGRSQSLGAAA